MGEGKEPGPMNRMQRGKERWRHEREGGGACAAWFIRAKTLRLYGYARASLQLRPGNAACNTTLRRLPMSLVSELPSSDERQ